MFPNNIVRLWNDNTHISSVREAIADTLILALDMKKVFTEDQFNYAFEFFEDILNVKSEEEVLDCVKYANFRVHQNEQFGTIEHIAERVLHLSKKERETILMLAIIYFHFSIPDDKRASMGDSFLPHFSIALGVHESVPKILKILRQIVGPRQSSDIAA